MSKLPESAVLAAKLADPRAILRPTPHDDDGSVLPEHASALTGPRVTTAKHLRRVAVLLVVSAAAVWFITIRVWDHEGFFPWFWNIVWLVFPWVFLGPFWAGTIRGIRQRDRDDDLHRQWDRLRAGAVHDPATVVESVHDRSEHGGVTHLALRVEGGGITTTLARFATTPGLLPSELPQPGDRVHRFTLPNGRVIVQASRRRGAAADAAPRTDLVRELERLAALRAAGALDEAEFDAAKAKLLD